MVVEVMSKDALGGVEDEVLALRAHQDFDAFAELYDRYLCRIYRFVRTQTPNDALAEDLTGQTFFRALSGARTFQGRGNYRSWIFRIARNTVVSWRVKHAKSPVSLEELPDTVDPAPSPAAVAVTGEEQRYVRSLVGTLPPAQREALSLRYLEDLTTEEVARVTGRTRGAVRVLLYRARGSLRRALEQRGLA